MKSIYRWLTCHPRLAKFLVAVVVTVICFLVLNPNIFPFLVRFLIVFFLLF